MLSHLFNIHHSRNSPHSFRYQRATTSSLKRWQRQNWPSQRPPFPPPCSAPIHPPSAALPSTPSSHSSTTPSPSVLAPTSRFAPSLSSKYEAQVTFLVVFIANFSFP